MNYSFNKMNDEVATAKHCNRCSKELPLTFFNIRHIRMDVIVCAEHVYAVMHKR
jgi:hypothetical protein